MDKKAILNYLNYYADVDPHTNKVIDECIEEVKKISIFKTINRKYTVSLSPFKIEELDLIIESDDLETYLEGCKEIFVVAATLGVQIDRQIKLYEKIDMNKALIFNAVSNHYLEYLQDEYEKNYIQEPHTFRFCPGYGDIDLSNNISLAKALDTHKNIGVSLTKEGLFVPMKTMLGIIGINKEVKKSCLSCERKERCSLRLGGHRCYVID